jgi:hypothetical protein
VQANVTDTDIVLERPRVMVGIPSTTEPAGTWSIEGYADDGTLLFQHRAHEGRWDHLDAVRPLSAAISINAETAATLTTITVRGPLGQQASAVFRAIEP